MHGLMLEHLSNMYLYLPYLARRPLQDCVLYLYVRSVGRAVTCFHENMKTFPVSVFHDM